jgi:hypothetical protein
MKKANDYIHVKMYATENKMSGMMTVGDWRLLERNLCTF